MEFRCDALLLDMDGTLVDSTECVERQWRRWAERHGLELEPILRVSHGRTTVETIQLVAPRLATAEEVGLFDVAEAEDTEGIKAVRGAVAFVSALPPDRWAVVTSAPRRLARVRLEHAGLPIPRVLVSADDVRRGKPDPEPYLTAARWIGQTAERCLVIEDAPAGVESARAAAMPVLGVTTTASREELGVPCIRDFEEVRVWWDGAAAEGALWISVAG
ncbi:MAG TPA: HAD-IA family hydrolase [Bryobacteraceae bacterium]|nr:HAD-IA family hydrolase [Bryobacteraceae bacterium]